MIEVKILEPHPRQKRYVVRNREICEWLDNMLVYPADYCISPISSYGGHNVVDGLQFKNKEIFHLFKIAFADKFIISEIIK